MVVSPAPPAGHPAAIAFWDLHRGLFARGSTVWLTTDGGGTFRAVLRTHERITGLQAFASRDAIVDLSRAGCTANARRRTQLERLPVPLQR